MTALLASLGIAVSLITSGASPAQAVTLEKYHWKSVKVVAGGFVSGILFHPKQKGLAYCRTDIGGAYRRDAKSHEWEPLLDWLTKPDWNLYGIESIGLDPNDPNKLYLACGTYLFDGIGNGAILRSNDQGRTFQRTDMPFRMGGNQDGRSIGERLAVDPVNGKHLYFGSRTSGLWESKDGAQTWNQVSSFPIKQSTDQIGVTVVCFALSKTNPTVYVATGDRAAPLYQSQDGGASWLLVPGTPTGFIPHQMKLSNTGDLYITCGNKPGPNDVSDGRVFKYSTQTGVWKDISPVTPNQNGEHGFGFAGLTLDPNAPNFVAVSTLDRWNPGDDVFRSTDGGKTWIGLSKSSTMDPSKAPYMTFGDPKPRFGWWLGALAVDPFDHDHILYGTGANIWATHYKPGPLTWQIDGQGMEETAVIDLLSPETGPHLISGLGDIGGFTHTDLDKSPPGMTRNPLLGNTDSLASAGLASEMIVRVGRGRNPVNGGFSLDSGLTWTEFGSSPTPKAEGGTIAVTADGAALIWAPDHSIPHYSADQGIIWAPSKGFSPTQTGGFQLVADRVLAGKIYAFRGREFFISIDGGVNFTPAGTVPRASGHIRAVPGKANEFWIPSQDGLFHTKDGGQTFVKVESVARADCIGFGKAASLHPYPAIFLSGKIGDSEGAFRSDDAGQTWVKITDPAHEYGTQDQIEGDMRIYGRVYLGTNGRGVLYGDK